VRSAQTAKQNWRYGCRHSESKSMTKHWRVARRGHLSHIFHQAHVI